jgi:hypothetical protein
MPSKRKQINVRADAETESRVRQLLPAVKEALGLEVTVSDLFRLGMIELERRYGRPSDQAADVKPARRKGKAK